MARPMHQPMRAVGYAVNVFDRIKGHLNHESSSYLMGLFEAVCEVKRDFESLALRCTFHFIFLRNMINIVIHGCRCCISFATELRPCILVFLQICICRKVGKLHLSGVVHGANVRHMSCQMQADTGGTSGTYCDLLLSDTLALHHYCAASSREDAD